MLGTISDEKVNNAISKGALKLSDDQIATVSFIFWLCYMAERDLEAVLTEPWDKIAEITKPEVVEAAKKMLDEMVFGVKQTEEELESVLKKIPEEEAKKIRAIISSDYRPRRIAGIDNLEYFTDKILMYQGIFGKNNLAQVLWDIKELRNLISHNQIDGLQYKGKDITLRSTKEALLMDYMGAVTNPDHSNSTIEKKFEFTGEDKEQIRKALEMLGIIGE